MKKRLLSLLLVFVMVLGIFPVTALATDKDVTVYLSFYNAEDGTFPVIRRAVTVSPGTARVYNENTVYGKVAEDFGMSVNHPVNSETDCTVVDALIQAHKDLYGDDFTADTAKSYLTAYDDWSYFEGIFNTNPPYGISYFVNGVMPCDAGGVGYAVNEYVLKDGDEICFFGYTDYTLSDYVSAFDKSVVTVGVNEAFTLTLKGHSAMDYYNVTVKPIADIPIHTLSVTGNSATVSEVPIGELTTDENGQVTLSFDQPGIYYLTAKGSVYTYNPMMYDYVYAPLIAPYCCVTVTGTSAPEPATYTVTLPESPEGYTVTAEEGSASPVAEGGSYSFKVSIADGYEAGKDFMVKANSSALEADHDGVYTISSINADQVVTVTGVVEETNLAAENVTIIAPAGSTISSGRFYSYFKYDFNAPLKTSTLEDGRLSYIFPVPSSQGFLRVQHPNGVTYWDFDGLSAGSVFEITKEMLFIGSTEYTKETVYPNYEKNKYDKADLYLTANAQGWLDMDSGDDRSLNVFRNWLALGNSVTNTSVALPDVEYKVVSIDGTPSDVVTVTPNKNNSSYADIKAEKPGTAIILVSYDAVYNNDGLGGKQFSAIWPENTGVIVVTVDAEDASITTNITVNEEANAGGKQIIDVEHDILFYIDNAGAEYSFKPEEGCTVTVARSTVGATMTFNGFASTGITTAEDGTVTVTGLTTGTHIIKVEKNGEAVYQVIRARQVSYELIGSDGVAINGDNLAEPGETITVQFHDLVSPMEKLSGVYNANFGFWYNHDKSGTKIRTGGGIGMYDFNGNEANQKFTVTVPSYWNEETFVLTDGAIKIGGFGGSFGNHRSTSYLAGKEVNTNASGVGGVLSVLPDITIPTKPTGINVYWVKWPTGEGYTVTGDATPITEGGSYTFNVTVKGGYDGNGMVVKVNGKTVVGTDGSYCVKNVTSDLNITIEGVTKITVEAPTNVTTVYTNGIDGTDWPHNKGYIDTVALGGVTVESYDWDDNTCTVTLDESTPDNAPVTFVITVGGKYANSLTSTLNGTDFSADAPCSVTLVGGKATVDLYAKRSTKSATKTFVLTIAEPEPEPTTYTVTPPENPVGYTVTAEEGSVSPVAEGGSYSFKVAISSGYKADEGFAVKVNGDALTAVDGVYTISNITANQTITVVGVEQKTWTVALPESPVGYTVTAEEGSASPVAEGGSYSFKVAIISGYKAGDDFAVKANGVDLTDDDGVYTISSITANQTITVEGVEKKPVTGTEVDVIWKNFRNSDVNMAITNAKTPISAEDAELKWKVGFQSENFAAAPSSQIIVDNAIIIMSGKTLQKRSLETGELIASADMSQAPSYGYTPPVYAEGLIICPLGRGTVEAFNAKTLEKAWTFTDALGGQALSPITYANGKVFTGFWISESENANYVCLDVKTGKLNWSYTSAGGFYWAGALAVGDYIVVGTDDASAASNPTTSKLLTFKQTYGETEQVAPVSSLTLTNMGDQRSAIAYANDRLYFTTKAGYLASAAINSSTGVLSDLKSVKYAGQITSTPVVYGDEVYFGLGDKDMTDPGAFVAADAATLQECYRVAMKAYPQSSFLLSTAYDDALYLYGTYNTLPGGITLIKADPNANKAEAIEVFLPEEKNQSICSIICDNEGTLYYKNDAGYVFAVRSKASDGKLAETKYAIDIASAEHGTVVSDKVQASAGTTVSLTIQAETGYELDTLTAGSADVTASGAAASFVMPAADVTVTAVFREADDTVQNLIDAIDALTVTEADEATQKKIAEIKAVYDALSAEDQAKVTNYSDLETAIAAFNRLLKETKEEAEQELEDLFAGLKEEDYTEENWEKVQALRNKALADVEKAENADEVSAVVRQTKTDLEKIATGNEITVTFRLIGDGKHDNGVTNHEEYVTWIPTTTYKLEPGATMYDVFMMAISDYGLSQRGAANNYVESIKAPSCLGGYWLGEFDNGPNAGWMYTVNGKHVGTGLKTYSLKDGDRIIWHYVDDYVQEERTSSSKYYYRWLEAKDISPEAYVKEKVGKILTVGEHGKAEPSEIKLSDVGKDITFTFKPDTGYVVKDVIIDGETKGSITTYTYKNLRYDSRIEVKFAKAGELFDDVKENDWFYDDVMFAVENGLFNGTGDNRFSPNASMNRAMLVTVLYRLEGEPQVTGSRVFNDVASGQWYTDAVIWATKNEIVNGYGNGKFGPTDNITREQMATILFRYAQFKKHDTSASNSLTGYKDFSDLSVFSLKAMKWANAEGLINGRTTTTLSPQGTATRAEVAAILHRFVENVVNE